MLHLNGIRYLGSAEQTYPFNLPLWRNLSEVTFASPLTFFVGENGSGKSTLLEGIAALVDLPAIGGQPLRQDASLQSARLLARRFRPIWTKKVQRGFFLRAEDFFGFIRSMESMRRDLQKELQEAEQNARNRSASEYAINQARTPWASQLAELQGRYGSDLDAASHGESFLQLLQARVVPEGLYLLDEPESALSPMRQLALIFFLHQAMQELQCQFIIATHSPILLAFPQAELLHFSSEGLKAVAYDDLEHVRFTRDFLHNPEAFLRFL